MFISPFTLTPLTDLSNILAPQHRHPPHDSACAKIEAKFLDCADAYGLQKIREKCAELLYDMVECSSHHAQIQRSKAMMKERMKKYREGKLSRPFEEHPSLDSYLGV